MPNFDRVVGSISRVLCWLAAGALAIMMLLTAANVIARPVYRSILGTPEIIAHAFVIVVCFGLAYTAVGQGHVSVELLVSRFPRRTQAAVGIITCLLSIGVFAVIAWQSAVFGWEKWLIGECEPVLGFPVPPFRFMVTLGCTVLCLVLLRDLFKSLAEVLRK